MPFDAIGIDSTKPISEEEYRQELEKVLVQLGKQGLDIETINGLRQEILARRSGDIDRNLAGYPPEMLAIVQTCLEEAFTGNLKPLVDFHNLFQYLAKYST